MFAYLLTIIKAFLGAEKQKYIRPMAIFAAVIFVVFLGITVPNPQPADALFPLIIGAVVVGGVLLNAAAGDPTGVATAVIDTAGSAVVGFGQDMLEGILNLLREFSGWLITLAGQFLTFILIDFNQSVGFYTNDMVIAGWGVVRDIANWFFIIMLIVIAIGTILGQEQFGVKRNLLRLIMVAILMNFSLVFVSIYINVTQLFMSFFIRTLTSPFQDIGKAIAFVGFSYAEFENYTPSGVDILAKFSNLLFISLFQFVGAFILLFIAILMIVRVAQLWLHMIMAPIAVVSTIIPKTQQFFGSWLNGLINWGLFGVIASFFMWLSTYLMAYLAKTDAIGTNVTALSFDGANPVITSMNLFLRFVTVSLFLFAGISYSKKMSGHAGNMVSDGIMRATGMAAAPGLAAGAMAARGSRRFATQELSARTAAQRERAANFLENRIPFVGGAAAKPIRAGIAKSGENIDTHIAEFRKEKAAMGKTKFADSIGARIKNKNFIGNREKQIAAILEAQTAGVDISTMIPDKDFEGLFKHAEVANREKGLAAVNPALVSRLKGLPVRGPGSVIEKYQLISPAQGAFISELALSNPDFKAEFLEKANGAVVQKMVDAGHAVKPLVDLINAIPDTGPGGPLEAAVKANPALFNYLVNNPAATPLSINTARIKRYI